MARLPIAIPPGLDALTPDVPATVFNEPFRLACERLDRYVGALALELAATLELRADSWTTPEALCAERGWARSGSSSLRWLLETLELYGAAERGPDGWRIARTAPGVPSSDLRAEAEAIVPSARPAYEVLALSAEALPAVLRGETRGEDALFGPAAMGLWFEYFSNSNPHYSPNNRLAALALARSVGSGARVLEVGGGGGSAALAALESLGAAAHPPSEYVFTELQPAFLRRGSRAVQQALPAGCRLRALRLDIDGDPVQQGLEAGQFDAVLGVNTFHLAREVVATLTRVRSLLRPGGVLVLGELVRPTATAPVHLELPFTLLASYNQVPLEEGVRARPGFMSIAGWRRALAAAGFEGVEVLPATIERCVEIYPGFYCGALTARA